MTVANKFEAQAIKFSEESKTVYISIEGYGKPATFAYTFYCKGLYAYLFFDMESKTMLWVNRLDFKWNQVHDCAMVKFWIENDLPVPSVKGFMSQEMQVLAYIADDFKEKLAAYTLDSIINQ